MDDEEPLGQRAQLLRGLREQTDDGGRVALAIEQVPGKASQSSVGNSRGSRLVSFGQLRGREVVQGGGHQLRHICVNSWLQLVGFDEVAPQGLGRGSVEARGGSSGLV